MSAAIDTVRTAGAAVARGLGHLHWYLKEIMGENGKKQIMEDLAVRKAVEFVVGESKEKDE